MDYSKEEQHEPKGSRPNAKKSGYGTDKIGGGGMKEFSSGVRELERQGMEHHHCVDGGMPNRMESHPEHRKGHEHGHFKVKK